MRNYAFSPIFIFHELVEVTIDLAAATEGKKSAKKRKVAVVSSDYTTEIRLRFPVVRPTCFPNMNEQWIVEKMMEQMTTNRSPGFSLSFHSARRVFTCTPRLYSIETAERINVPCHIGNNEMGESSFNSGIRDSCSLPGDETRFRALFADFALAGFNFEADDYNFSIEDRGLTLFDSRGPEHTDDGVGKAEKDSAAKLVVEAEKKIDAFFKHAERVFDECRPLKTNFAIAGL